MNYQIRLLVTLAGRDDYHTAEILLDGGVPVSALPAACMKAVLDQHPHFAGQPISAIKYDVKANDNG